MLDAGTLQVTGLLGFSNLQIELMPRATPSLDSRVCTLEILGRECFGLPGQIQIRRQLFQSGL